MYLVKEIFKTLQGEGLHTGKPAVFCRFAGCNLWSGLESARPLASCKFCDTDFKGTNGTNGGKYSHQELVHKITELWGLSTSHRFVVLTGGEPMLQVDQTLIDELHNAHFLVAIETNGTIPVPQSIDHICVSPKSLPLLKQKSGHEIKVVYPDVIDPQDLQHLPFNSFYIQPKDDPNLSLNTRLAVEYCLHNPQWRLSLQTHKLIGIS